jgi:hypothetical protein
VVPVNMAKSNTIWGKTMFIDYVVYNTIGTFKNHRILIL